MKIIFDNELFSVDVNTAREKLATVKTSSKKNNNKQTCPRIVKNIPNDSILLFGLSPVAKTNGELPSVTKTLVVVLFSIFSQALETS